MPQPRVRKAVLPAAGLGTRFLPAAKAQPKEMLPVVDRPAIQYVVEECVRAGLDDILLVTGRGKRSLEDHFDRAPELERVLRDKGKHELLSEIEGIADLATVHSVRQGEPLGLGHAVLQAREHVGSDSCAVLLGDDLLDADEKFLERMIGVHESTGRAVVAVMPVPDDEVHRYGVVTATETEQPGIYDTTDLVEKPPPDEAPSNLAVIGRYVLPAEVFDVLAETPPGSGGEIQLTDALRALARDEPIVSVRYDGVRHDIGNKLGFLQATVDLAANRPDLGPDFLAWLRDYLAARDDG